MVGPNGRDVSLGDVRILLVEDEPESAEFVKRLLEDYGADVTVVASAPAALECLKITIPDILIGDIGLPEMDGYELIERIRRRSVAEGGTIPAVALTAFARSEDRTRALRAGYQAHIAKPPGPECIDSFARLQMPPGWAGNPAASNPLTRSRVHAARS